MTWFCDPVAGNCCPPQPSSFSVSTSRTLLQHISPNAAQTSDGQDGSVTGLETKIGPCPQLCERRSCVDGTEGKRLSSLTSERPEASFLGRELTNGPPVREGHPWEAKGYMHKLALVTTLTMLPELCCLGNHLNWRAENTALDNGCLVLRHMH